MSKLKDFISKYATKSVLIASLVVISFVGIYIAINQHSKLTQARAELSQSNLYIDLVEKEKSRLDSTARALNVIIKDRDAFIVIQDNKIKLGWKTIGMLQDSLKNVLTNVTEVNADSSYNYLNMRIPAVAPLTYPFDSLQVKKIHYTFVERDGLFSLTYKQGILLEDYRVTSIFKDGQIYDLKTLNSIYKSKEHLYTVENEAIKKENSGLKKVVKQQKFLKSVMLAPAVIGVITVIKLILIK